MYDQAGVGRGEAILVEDRRLTCFLDFSPQL